MNSHKVLAKFTGKEICVSYRYYHSVHNRHECKSDCFDAFEGKKYSTEDYFSNTVCSHIRCTGGFRSIRFRANPSFSSSPVNKFWKCYEYFFMVILVKLFTKHHILIGMVCLKK